MKTQWQFRTLILVVALLLATTLASAQAKGGEVGVSEVGTIDYKTIDGKVWVEAKATEEKSRVDVETFRVLNTTTCMGVCEIPFEISNPTKDDIKSSITTDLEGNF